MPANSTGTIKVNVDVSTYVAVPALNTSGTYTFSPEDNTVRFRKIPANAAGPGVGLLIDLPANPSDGDEYEWVDADGSCSAGNIVILRPDPAGTATFAAQNGPGVPSPLPTFAFAERNSGARVQFDAGSNQWLLWESVTSRFNTAANYASSQSKVTPGNFAGGAAINLAAFLVKPQGSGIFNLRSMLRFIAGAADAAVIVGVEVIPNVTAFSGGTIVGFATAPTMRYETGAGPGQPVVVTGDAPSGTWQEWEAQVDATGLTNTATLAQDITVPTALTAGALGHAIVVTLADTAAALTGLEFAGSVQEIN